LTLGPKDPVSPQGASIKKCGKVRLFWRVSCCTPRSCYSSLLVGEGGGGLGLEAV
jgi:hypothetical protein